MKSYYFSNPAIALLPILMNVIFSFTCFAKESSMTLDETKVMGVTPEDILPGGQDTAVFHGLKTRKGTIKAAIENVKILNSRKTSEKEKEDAKKTLKDLIPFMVALELNEYVVWKNSEVQKMFDEYLAKK